MWYQCTINKLECLGEWAYRSALKESIYSNECNETQVVQNSSFRKMPCYFQIKVALCTTAYVGKDVVQDSYIPDPFSFELNSSKVRHFLYIFVACKTTQFDSDSYQNILEHCKLSSGILLPPSPFKKGFERGFSMDMSMRRFKPAEHRVLI